MLLASCLLNKLDVYSSGESNQQYEVVGDLSGKPKENKINIILLTVIFLKYNNSNNKKNQTHTSKLDTVIDKVLYLVEYIHVSISTLWTPALVCSLSYL